MADPIISTFNDLYSAGSDELSLRNPDLTDRAAGSVNDAYLGAGAAIADEVLVQALRKISETFVDTAEKAALDKKAFDVFSLVRKPANQALGSITLSRANTDAGEGEIPIGSRFTTNPGGTGEKVEFETTELKILTGLSVSISAKAVSPGPQGNVSENTITQVKSTLFDASITVNNPAKFAGGENQESDPSFRDRIKAYPSTLRRGTPEALIYGAKTVGGVSFANLDESTAADGYITLYIGDQGGNSSAELVDKVETEMDSWRAAGVILNVSGAVPVTQAIDFSPIYEAGVDIGLVSQKASKAAKEYRDGLDVGETLYYSALSAAVQKVEGIKGVNFNVPNGDVVPDPNEIFRGGNVTIS